MYDDTWVKSLNTKTFFMDNFNTKNSVSTEEWAFDSWANWIVIVWVLRWRTLYYHLWRPIYRKSFLGGLITCISNKAFSFSI